MKKDLDDLSDMTEMLRQLSNAENIDKWITDWRAKNTENSGCDNWNDSFPSVEDISITSDIVDGMIQIWVEKHFYFDGKVLRVAQQVF